MSNWIEGSDFPSNIDVEIEIQHCNPRLNLKNEIVTGRWGDDGFYFEDGSELSFNWNIIRWRRI